MLFRAVFWIGVVATLMPHESGSIPISGVPSLNGTAGMPAPAGDDILGALQQRLAAVKADIEAAERSRAAKGD